jgi:hypothetical protein
MELDCDHLFDYSVSARPFSISNSQKSPTRLFPPIWTSCESRSVDSRRNTLALLVGRRVSATHYRRGTTFTRRGTTRRQNSEPRRPGWLLLARNAVSTSIPPSSLLFSFSLTSHSQAGLGSPRSRTTVGRRAGEGWSCLGGDNARREEVAIRVTAFGGLLRGRVVERPPELTNVWKAGRTDLVHRTAR